MWEPKEWFGLGLSPACSSYLSPLLFLPPPSFSLEKPKQDRKNSTNIVKCKCRGFCARALFRRESLNLPIRMGSFIPRVHSWINSFYSALVFPAISQSVYVCYSKIKTSVYAWSRARVTGNFFSLKKLSFRDFDVADYAQSPRARFMNYHLTYFARVNYISLGTRYVIKTQFIISTFLISPQETAAGVCSFYDESFKIFSVNEFSNDLPKSTARSRLSPDDSSPFRSEDEPSCASYAENGTSSSR